MKMIDEFCTFSQSPLAGIKIFNETFYNVFSTNWNVNILSVISYLVHQHQQSYKPLRKERRRNSIESKGKSLSQMTRKTAIFYDFLICCVGAWDAKETLLMFTEKYFLSLIIFPPFGTCMMPWTISELFIPGLLRWLS